MQQNNACKSATLVATCDMEFRLKNGACCVFFTFKHDNLKQRDRTDSVDSYTRRQGALN